MQTSFCDSYHEKCYYSVSAVNTEEMGSLKSFPNGCFSGYYDNKAQQLNIISPVVTHPEEQLLSLKITLIDNRAHKYLSATLYYRKPGETNWSELPMLHKDKAIFTVDLQVDLITKDRNIISRLRMVQTNRFIR